MPLDASSAIAPPPLAPAPGPVAKVRLRFAKSGALRLLSHHDLLRTFERMLRRAALPVRATQGFHPKPRLVFALSLPLGVVGCAEVVELELTESLAADTVRDRLRDQAPPGLVILSAEPVAPRAQAQVRRLCYRVALPAAQVAELRERLPALLAATECWVERSRPARRRNIRPFIHDLRVAPDSETNYLEMELLLTPAGTARPDELLALLGIRDLLEAGAVLERAWLELHDESAALDRPTAAGDSTPTAEPNLPATVDCSPAADQ